MNAVMCILSHAQDKHTQLTCVFMNLLCSITAFLQFLLQTDLLAGRNEHNDRFNKFMLYDTGISTCKKLSLP